MEIWKADTQLNASPFAAPRVVTSLEECYFYHTMDLPGHGTVQGEWDLRSDVDSYLGGVDVRGKRVLEMGTASGFLCVEMEKRGAEVIGYDLSDEHDWDVVPFASLDLTRHAAERKEHLRRLNNGWWLVHRAFESSARVVYGTAYEVPAAIGPVDVATFGCILLHLRDPFQALASAARLVRETIIVTEADNHWDLLKVSTASPSVAPRDFRARILSRFHRLLGDDGWWKREELLPAMQHRIDSLADAQLMQFLPNHRVGGPVETWWAFRPQALAAMLGVLGFPHTTVTFSQGALFHQLPQNLFTVVGRRG